MDDCCKPPKMARKPGACPQCGQKGRPVGHLTLEHLLQPAALESLDRDATYFFCPTPACDTVYHGAGVSSFLQRDLRVRVGLKVDEPPVPVCYCFGITEADIASEVARAGRSSAHEVVTAKVRAGECACETTNPQGTCCLGNIAIATRKVMAERSKATRIG